MKQDIEIAQEAKMLPISQVAENFGIDPELLEPYGKYKAKFCEDIYNKVEDQPNGKLILVTAINPTPAGEGKTTNTIGLAQALNIMGKKTIAALREPSLGPCMGVKGGAAGGGYSQVLPMEDINLHFTGDIHAMTTANNLLSAIIDNHILQGNALNIDPCSITWKRAMDMNDRALRNIVVGLGGKANGVPREDGFLITVASEIMAIVCLSEDIDDLKERLGKIIIGYNYNGEPVTAGDLHVNAAMASLLKEAIKPNLVQTLEGTPAIIHGGPFANIAHGCNSMRATKLSLKLADYVVTEAGFGADLGAEKFFDIKCRKGGLKPNAVVLVATVRALKYNGGVNKKELAIPNAEAVRKGVCNLRGHIENLQKFNVPVVVALNRFESDTPDEIDVVKMECERLNAEFALSQVWEKGGAGGLAVAEKVLEAIDKNDKNFKYLYEDNIGIKEKLDVICREIYGASGVEYTPKADKDARKIKKLGLSHFPVCVAKTQYSFSDDPNLLGRPEGFRVTVKELKISAGAGFIVAITGDIMTMPGLPKTPSAENINVDSNGSITGLF